jgi:hypothetical protein
MVLRQSSLSKIAIQSNVYFMICVGQEDLGAKSVWSSITNNDLSI